MRPPLYAICAFAVAQQLRARDSDASELVPRPHSLEAATNNETNAESNVLIGLAVVAALFGFVVAFFVGYYVGRTTTRPRLPPPSIDQPLLQSTSPAVVHNQTMLAAYSTHTIPRTERNTAHERAVTKLPQQHSAHQQTTSRPRTTKFVDLSALTPPPNSTRHKTK